MAEKDVFNLIVDVCESSINSMKDCNNVTELASAYVSTLYTIMGTCAGAKGMKKESKEEEKCID